MVTQVGNLISIFCMTRDNYGLNRCGHYNFHWKCKFHTNALLFGRCIFFTTVKCLKLKYFWDFASTGWPNGFKQENVKLKTIIHVCSVSNSVHPLNSSPASSEVESRVKLVCCILLSYSALQGAQFVRLLLLTIPLGKNCMHCFWVQLFCTQAVFLLDPHIL